MDPLSQYLLVSLPHSTISRPFLERQSQEANESRSEFALPNFHGDTLKLLLQVSGELAKSYSSSSSLQQGRKPVSIFKLPNFHIKTLDSLVQISEELSKLDSSIASSVSKVADVMDNIEPKKASRANRFVNGKSVSAYVETFSWNTSKYRLDKSIKDLVDLISNDAAALDNDVRQAYQQYQTAKSNFMVADRKKNGDLSVKSLHEIVRPEHFVLDSDYLTTVLVAVPKSLSVDFHKSYESVTELVIPRSAQLIAKEGDYELYTVALFKKAQQHFINACREKKWHPRTDFVYSEENMNQLRKEFDVSKVTEMKSKNDLIRLAKTAYSDIFSGWFHIKAIRVYVESVLRYGLPPQFDSFAIRFEDQSSLEKAKKELIAKFGYLGGDGFSDKSNLHEYASLVDSEYEPFVLYRVDVV